MFHWMSNYDLKLLTVYQFYHGFMYVKYFVQLVLSLHGFIDKRLA